jgi:hypothetical protein
MSHVVGFGWRFVLWFVAVFPYSPSIVALYWASTYCFTPIWASTGIAPGRCLLTSAYMAPAALLIGPLAGSNQDPASAWLAVLATAFLLALLITTLGLVLRRRRRQPST